MQQLNLNLMNLGACLFANLVSISDQGDDESAVLSTDVSINGNTFSISGLGGASSLDYYFNDRYVDNILDILRKNNIENSFDTDWRVSENRDRTLRNIEQPVIGTVSTEEYFNKYPDLLKDKRVYMWQVERIVKNVLLKEFSEIATNYMQDKIDSSEVKREMLYDTLETIITNGANYNGVEIELYIRIEKSRRYRKAYTITVAELRGYRKLKQQERK